ncbi:hypothetical protein [Vulgatibacter incomptus]|uniref:Uncharacterized protein n=1 Tax=Vulgatibacter incomptus TaxID=1391653 RepID=A0A0K1PFD8_9BACT|nr:hypothetical protein [Vulgatibacter incomptus]AKU92151.1 hypothetical protein AKJ08_2538 [Vulgatibacter incomptus]
MRLFPTLGFRLALVYGAAGLSLEVLHHHLPESIYRRTSDVLCALPSWLIATLGFDSTLNAAMATGRLPAWLAGTAVPLVGVASILLLSLGVGLLWTFGGAIGSLKHR